MTEQTFPEPCVGALIFNPAGKLFLMKSHKWHNRYVVPGGHIELGETMEQALKREIMEETGFVISDINFICFQEFIFDNAFWKKKHFVFFDFACRASSANAKLNSEAQEYVWVSVEDALKLPVEPYTVNIINEFRKKFPKGIQPQTF
jgi:nucleoside triphosphatase